MAQKWSYDLSHYSMQCGRIGYLQGLGVIPVVAGDEMSLSLNGVFRLSPLRRQLMIDAKVDLFAFYIPHRQIYGSDWTDFIKDGLDESVTFTGITAQAGGASSHLGVRVAATEEVPLWLVYGYNRIWNRYFRHPTADGDIKADTDKPAALAAGFGYGVGHLPSIWNTPIDGEVTSADYTVTTAATDMSLLEFAQQKARLSTERRREWYAQRYHDLLKSAWGGWTNIDADERPELVMRNSFWLSGYDVDGTDNASLGTYVGKAAAVGDLRIPRKTFPEHGALWIMGVVRFPPIHEAERPYLCGVIDPSYKEIAGDCDVLAAEGPEIVDVDDYMVGDGHVADVGVAPYGQWYRYHPSHVHQAYATVGGFTWLNDTLSSKALARYMDYSSFDHVFSTTQLGHWQMQARVDVDCRRCVPPVEASIFAGSKGE